MNKEQLEIKLKTIFQKHATKVGDTFYIADKMEERGLSQYDNFILEVIKSFPQLHIKKEKNDD